MMKNIDKLEETSTTEKNRDFVNVMHNSGFSSESFYGDSDLPSKFDEENHLNLKNKIVFLSLWHLFFSPLATFFTFLENKDSVNSHAVIGVVIGAIIGAIIFIQFFLFLPSAPVGIALHLGIASAAETTAVLAAIAYGMILLPSMLFKGVGIVLAKSGASTAFIVNTALFGRDVATTIALLSNSEITTEEHCVAHNGTSSTASILNSQGGPLASNQYEFDEGENLEDEENLEWVDRLPKYDEAAEEMQDDLSEMGNYDSNSRRNSF